MSLTLIDPSPASVITHDGGLISVRCADFLGAARGTLSTEADALSAAGDVIRDDQAIAVQTTFTSTGTRFALAADTFTIPLSSLGREPGVNYRVFLSCKLEGAPPSNAVANSTFARYNIQNGAGLGIGYSINGSFQDGMQQINKETCTEYALRQITAFLSQASTTGNYALRAWGITGGTVSMLLDTLYFIPSSNSSEPDERFNEISPGDFAALTLFSNGVLFRDEDVDDSWWPGAHSVFYWNSPWAPDDMDWGQLVDFQEDDSEPTSANLNGDGSWDNPPLPADPKSWMWILAGGTNIPAATIITDPFDVTSDSAPPGGETYLQAIDGYIRECEVGVQSQVQYFWSAGRRGFFVEAGSGIATCYFGSSVGQPITGGPGPFPPTTVFRAECYWGEYNRLGGVSSTDPRNYYPRFERDLECWEQVCKFRMRDNSGRASAALGQFCADTSGGIDPTSMYTAWLQWDGSDLDLWLTAGFEFASGYQPTYAGPASITTSYSLDDWYWLRVQKQGYIWRARAWADGGSEPSTWDLEAFQPILKGSTAGLVDYEYNVNWPLSVTNDTVIFEPRGGPGGIAATHNGAFGGCGIRCTADYNQARMRIECDDYQMDWNPSSGTPGDMNVRVEKYDGSVDYGSVVVPYGAHRIVAASRDRYNFNNDTDGVNIYAWKDAGQPDFMTAGIGRVFQRAPFSAYRPQIYRLVIF